MVWNFKMRAQLAAWCTHQNVDGERHDHEGDQQIGQRQTDDKVIGDGLQGPFPAHTDYYQHVAEQREYWEHDQPERPIVLDDDDAGILVAPRGVVENGRRRRGERGTVAAVGVFVRVIKAADVRAACTIAVHRRRRGRPLGHRRSGRGRGPVSEQLARGRRGRDLQQAPLPQQQRQPRHVAAGAAGRGYAAKRRRLACVGRAAVIVRGGGARLHR